MLSARADNNLRRDPDGDRGGLRCADNNSPVHVCSYSAHIEHKKTPTFLRGSNNHNTIDLPKNTMFRYNIIKDYSFSITIGTEHLIFSIIIFR